MCPLGKIVINITSPLGYNYHSQQLPHQNPWYQAIKHPFVQAIALMGRLAELRPKLFSSFREDKVKDSMDFWDSFVVDHIDLVHSLVMSSECPSFLDKQTQKISTNSTIILTFCPQKLGSGPSSSSSEGSAAMRGKMVWIWGISTSFGGEATPELINGWIEALGEWGITVECSLEPRWRHRPVFRAPAFCRRGCLPLMSIVLRWESGPK